MRILCKRLYSTPIKLNYIKQSSANGLSKSPFVILHGLFGSSRNWNTVSRLLSSKSGEDVYSLDLRNHGKSVPLKQGYPVSWDLMIKDLSQLLTDHSLSNINLIGHSLGGQLAMQSLFSGNTNIIDRTSKLIVVDISPRKLKFVGSSLEILLKALIEIEKEKYVSRLQAVEHLRNYESVGTFNVNF